MLKLNTDMKQNYQGLVITGRREMGKLERFVEEVCEYYNVNNDYFGNILLAVTEAAEILFAIIETIDPGSICIQFDRNRKGMVFTIKQNDGVVKEEGEEDVLDREIRRHRLSRDIYIIKALADEITISVNARSIVLVFYVSSMNFETSLYRINKLKEYWEQKEKVIQKK